MKKRYFSPDRDGFYGVYYPLQQSTKKAMIVMLGDSSDDRMAVSGAKWMHKQSCNVLAMSPDKQDYGHHNYPLERFEKAITFLKSQGNEKIGIAGASTTGMMALVAASYFPDITLTIAISPPDFVTEGFYQDGKDGAHERPSYPLILQNTLSIQRTQRSVCRRCCGDTMTRTPPWSCGNGFSCSMRNI